MAKLYASIRTQLLDVLVQSRTISQCPALLVDGSWIAGFVDAAEVIKPPDASVVERVVCGDRDNSPLYPVEDRDDIVHE
jgi:hypothetical protein